MASPARRTGLAAMAAFAAGLLGVALWWTHPPDPERVLRDHAPRLERLERDPIAGFGPGIERWRLITVAGDTASGLWRAAAPGVVRPWTVVMLGGLTTGERAVLLLPPGLPVNALAMDWPWRGPGRLPPLELLASLGRIQDAVLRSPGALALGVQAVARQPEVDSTRIVLLGASLGAPPAVAALRLSRTPAALVILDGAADLETLLRVGLLREGCPRRLARPAAALAYRLARPLEPSLSAGAASGRRVMLINAEHDEYLPRSCVLRLHAAFPGATVRWRAEPHIRPGRRGDIAAIAREVDAWLEAP